MKVIHYLRFFTSSFFYNSFKSIFYLSLKRKTDVFLYYPQHFNYKTKKPFCFSNMINSMQNNNIDFVIFEEPNIFCNESRSKDIFPFDIIWLLVIIFRKFYRGRDYGIIDVKIGKLLSNILFIKRDVKNIITVSQSFQSVFRGMFPKAVLYDYQHGLISKNYNGYIINSAISKNILNNNSRILLFGEGFKKKILNVDGGVYFKNHSHVIGSTYRQYNKPRKSFNGNILFTLQFTKSHSKDYNIKLLNKTIDFFNEIESNKINIKLFIKNHPRFENCLSTNVLYDYNFVENAPDKLIDCFKICNLHITEYSTVLFDSIFAGIPSILTRFSSEINIYKNEYNFPCEEFSVLKSLKRINDDSYYQQLINKQIRWSKDLYEPFKEKKFIELINNYD